MATIRTTRIVTIEANIVWRAFQSPSSKRWIGVCKELNLTLEADSENDLRSLIPEALHLLMIDLLEDNELEKYLRAKGWRAHNVPARPDSDVKFDVPWELVHDRARRGNTERRAN